MEWYHLFNPLIEKFVALAILAIAFALILYRKFNITYISLAGAALLIASGIIAPMALSVPFSIVAVAVPHLLLQLIWL